MAQLKGKELTPELIRKAMACGTVEDLLALAKENGVEITAEEAAAYLEEMSCRELPVDVMEKVSGGGDTPPDYSYCYKVDMPRGQ